MLSVDYTTYTVKVHDVSAEHKTANHHLSLVLSNIDYAEKEHKICVIAWVLLLESRWLRSLAARNPEAFRASTGHSPEKKEEVEGILKHIEDPNFWNQLAELKLYLEPLAIAANVSQAPTTCLDHILIELGPLYCVFLHLAFNPKIRDVVLASLECRWGKADQDPFILAVFFNPFIRGRLFNCKNILLNRSALYGTIRWVFRRVFCKDNDLELYEAFLDYYESRNEFSPDRWDYQEQHALHERAVFDTAVVRMNLKRKHAAEGRTRSRLKRQFGSSALDSGMSTARVEINQPDDLGEAIVGIDDANEDLAPPTMRSLATQFHQDLLDDEDPPELDHEDDESPRTNA
ncbi:hypothetical protein FRC11_013152, partial [Ceratobasidium sp. 423]